MASKLIAIVSSLCGVSFIVLYSLILYFNLETGNTRVYTNVLRILFSNHASSLLHSISFTPFKHSIGYWRGTRRGCNCLNVTSEDLPSADRGKLLPRRCSRSTEICTDVDEIEMQNVYQWKNFSMSAVFKSYSDLYSLISDNGKDCLDGYRKCGVLDTVGQPLCIKNGFSCPVNRFVSSNSSSPPDAKYNYTLVTSVDGSYLFATNEAIDQPVFAELAISEGDYPLRRDRKYCLPTKYKLDHSSVEYCKDQTQSSNDSFFFKIDSMSKKTFLREIGVLKEVEGLPAIPADYFDHPIRLNARNYFGFKKECMKKHGLKPYDFRDSVNTFVEENSDWFLAIHVVTLIGIVGQLAFCGLFFKYKQRFWSLFIIFQLFQLIPVVICLAGVVTFYQGLHKFPFQTNCSDDITNQVINNDYPNYKGQIEATESNLIVSCLGLLPFLVIVVFCWITKDQIKADLFSNKTSSSGIEAHTDPHVDNLNKEYPGLAYFKPSEDKATALFYDEAAPKLK